MYYDSMDGIKQDGWNSLPSPLGNINPQEKSISNIDMKDVSSLHKIAATSANDTQDNNKDTKISSKDNVDTALLIDSIPISGTRSHPTHINVEPNTHEEETLININDSIQSQETNYHGNQQILKTEADKLVKSLSSSYKTFFNIGSKLLGETHSRESEIAQEAIPATFTSQSDNDLQASDHQGYQFNINKLFSQYVFEQFSTPEALNQLVECTSSLAQSVSELDRLFNLADQFETAYTKRLDQHRENYPKVNFGSELEPDVYHKLMDNNATANQFSCQDSNKVSFSPFLQSHFAGQIATPIVHDQRESSDANRVNTNKGFDVSELSKDKFNHLEQANYWVGNVRTGNQKSIKKDHSTYYSTITKSKLVGHLDYSDVDPKAVVKRQRPNLPDSARAVMTRWLEAHLNSPYPSENEKIELAKNAKITINQLNNWFINARRRPSPQLALAQKNSKINRPGRPKRKRHYVSDGANSAECP